MLIMTMSNANIYICTFATKIIRCAICYARITKLLNGAN